MVVIAAGIAEAQIWRTAWHAMRLATVFIIVPFVFIYNPAILLQGDHSIIETISVVVSCLIGVLGLSSGVQGWLFKRPNLTQRILLIISGMMLILNINIVVSLGGFFLLILVAVSGWVIYRYRETRALTLAQFFEMRYNRKFRVFTGFIAFFAGLLNFGIFPTFLISTFSVSSLPFGTLSCKMLPISHNSWSR